MNVIWSPYGFPIFSGTNTAFMLSISASALGCWPFCKKCAQALSKPDFNTSCQGSLIQYHTRTCNEVFSNINMPYCRTGPKLLTVTCFLFNKRNSLKKLFQTLFLYVLKSKSFPLPPIKRNISKVTVNIEGVSQLHNMLEIYHSGLDPSILNWIKTFSCMWDSSLALQSLCTTNKKPKTNQRSVVRHLVSQIQTFFFFFILYSELWRSSHWCDFCVCVHLNTHHTGSDIPTSGKKSNQCQIKNLTFKTTRLDNFKFYESNQMTANLLRVFIDKVWELVLCSGQNKLA